MSIDLCPRSWRPELTPVQSTKNKSFSTTAVMLSFEYFQIKTFVTLVRQKDFVLHKYTFTVYEDNHVNDDKPLLPSVLLATQPFP